MNKIGKMHQVKEYYWLVFPRKENVLDLPHDPAAILDAIVALDGTATAAYWSKQLNCNVTYISPNDFVFLLEVDRTCKKVLTSNGDIGWIWFGEDYNNYFEEVNQ